MMRRRVVQDEPSPFLAELPTKASQTTTILWRFSCQCGNPLRLIGSSEEACPRCGRVYQVQQQVVVKEPSDLLDPAAPPGPPYKLRDAQADFAFTYGPWAFDPETHQVSDGEDYLLAAVEEFEYEEKMADITLTWTGQANGQLMAAAPELYEAVVSAIGAFRTLRFAIPMEDEPYEFICEEEARLQKALDRADGRPTPTNDMP